MAAADDVAASIGVPDLVPQAPPPQPAPAAAPPQGTPGGLDPRVVWTVGGEAAGDLPGRQAVASVVRNRISAGAPDPVSVVSEPGQFRAYDSVDATAKRFPVGSPQYNELEGQIAPIISGAQPPTVPYTGFRTHGYTSPGAPWYGSSPVTTIGGNDFATVPYKYSGGPSAAQNVATSIGLSADEQKSLAGYTGPQAATPEASQPGPGHVVNFGPQFAHVSSPAEQTYAKIQKERGLGGEPGSPTLPWYIPPGQVAPATAGDHWVDINGTEHINPGGVGERALNALQGFTQGTTQDVAASIGKLTGGFAGPGRGPVNALLGLAGVPSQTNQAYLQGNQAQQRAYSLQHHGDPFAQTGRFFGQAAPATAASVAVPEVEAPAFLGSVGERAAAGLTNALRGVAATAPSVGANSAPVLQQLATGAVAGTVAPIVIHAGGEGVKAVTGVGREVSPDVATLADVAKNKYGIDLASGQVMGAAGDRGAATAYSNMTGSNAGVYARNAQQRQQWMKGVTNTYGDASGDVSPLALAANRAKIGAAIQGAADRIGSIDASAVPERLDGIVANAKQDIGFNGNEQLANLVNRIKGAIDPITGTMPATAFKDVTDQASPLMTAVQAGEHPYANQIKNALFDALEGSADPADVAALRDNRWKYKNVMTVAKAAQNQNNIGIDGVFTPAALNTATTSNFKDRAFQGAGDLDELNKIRKFFMTEPPNSFTADRSNDFLHGLRNATVGGLATEGLLALASHPEQVVPSALVGIGGATAKAVGAALKANKIGGSAAGIIQRSLPQTPGSINALTGLRGVSKAVEVPLSALAGVRGAGAIQPAGAQ